MPPPSTHWALLTCCCALLLSGVLASSETALAQAGPPMLDPDWQISQYAHRAWGVEDGLPQSSLGAITQTRDGYLWLGTQEGIARFDGVAFDVFDQGNAPALQNDWVKVLLEDRSGALWIGTGGGGLARRGRGGGWTHYTTEDGLAGDVVRALYEDREGVLWIGTIGGGLSLFDGSTFTTYTTRDDLPSDKVVAIDGDSSGAVWVATTDGLARFEDSKLVARYTQDKGLPASRLNALEVSASGDVWLGTEQGLLLLRDSTFAFHRPEKGPCGSPIEALLEDQSGSLWIGTRDEGLCRFRDDAFDVFTEEDGLTHAMVRALYEDREGNLWIGTESGGLNRLTDSKFAAYTTKQGLSSNVVYSVYEDQEGAIWLGTEGGGLNRIQDDEVTVFTTEDGLSSDIVLALGEDNQGRLWVGTFDGGLCRREGGTFTCFDAEDGLGSNFVSAVIEDRQGNMWAATDGGLSRFQRGKFTTLTTEDGLPSDNIVTLLEDVQGHLWIGTWSGGVSRMDQDGHFTNYAKEAGLSSDNVTVLHEDQQKRLWVGTHSGGLCLLQEDRFACVTERDGLHHNDVLQIVEDDEGYLWLGSNQGLSRLRLASVEAYLEGRLDRLTPALYNRKDGLETQEMNGGTQPSALRSRDGGLWFATMHGAAFTTPAHLRPNPVPPPVNLVSFAVDGEPLPLDGEPHAPAGSRRFVFQFTAPSFVAPEQVRFRYKLEGYDDDWTDVQNQRTEHYTNLPPGAYRFRVMASNNDGVWAEQEASVPFEVAALFYQTFWFRALCGIGLLLAATGIIRLRVRHLEAREQHLKQRVEEQTEKLRAQKRELELLNGNLHDEVQRQLDLIMEERSRYENELILAKDEAEASARFKTTILDNISHEIRTPITAIVGYSEILSAEVGENLQEFAGYVLQNGTRLRETVDSILNFSQLEADKMPLHSEVVDLNATAAALADQFQEAAAAKGLTLRYRGSAAPVAAKLDSSALQRILENLISNAIKFTQEGEVTVEVSKKSRSTCISVRDTGIGISEAFLPDLFEAFKQESDGLSRTHEGSGLGLAISRRLAESMGGTIKVETRKGEGSTFTACFPAAIPAKPALASRRTGRASRPREAHEERSPAPGVPPANTGNPQPDVHANGSKRDRMPSRAPRLPKRLGAPEARPGQHDRSEKDRSA